MSDQTPKVGRVAATVSRPLLGVLFIVAGVLHFVVPQKYEAIVPRFIPAPLAMVYVSGLAEILGGVGVLLPRWRVLAGYWLIALLVAVFPANINMAVDPESIPDLNVPGYLLWLRLPLQVVLIWWVWRATRPQQKPDTAATSG